MAEAAQLVAPEGTAIATERKIPSNFVLAKVVDSSERPRRL